MLNRSDIDLIANSTSGINLGNGTELFKCKDITGNTLQFKTILVTGGSLSIITGDTTITINSTGGGAITGTTNYIPRFDSIGNNLINSSIFDSGTTNCDNVRLFRYNLFLGDNVANGCKITIRPSFTRKIELIAPSGVNIGDLNACVCIGCTTDGLTLCAATYQDLLLHAGTAVSAGCAGKTLRLSGGDGVGAAGGNVILTGGTGTVGGNILLSTSNSGKVIISNLPAKTTETCAIYVNAGGCLAKGIVGTGMTTISGTATRIPVFNASGTNISATTMSFISNKLCNSNDLIIEVPSTKSIFFHAPVAANVNQITLGCANMVNTITENRINSCGQASSINLGFFAKNNGCVYFIAPTVYLSNNGSGGLKYSALGGSLELPFIARISNCNADQFTPEAKSLTIVGGCGYGAPTYAGSGATINICGGDAGSGTGAPKIGGSVIVKAGLGAGGGVNGRIQLCGLPAKTSESCVVYIDSTGRLSTGVSSGGTGGLSVAVTGATNGVCLYNSMNVCLGGSISGLGVLCANGVGNGLTICSICGSCCASTSLCCGGDFSSSINNATTWCGCIANSGSIQINSANAASVCKNEILIRPDAVYFTVTGPAGNTGFQYAADYCTKMNANCRVIPDVDWVKRYAIGGWSNLTKGSTVVGCGTQISGGTLCQNTFYGTSAGVNTTTGCGNVAIGTSTLPANTSGCFNIAIGLCALQTNTIGCGNIANGFGTLNKNISGNYNTAIGFCALCCNTIGNYNTAIGLCALSNNLSGIGNVGIGVVSLLNNTTGSYNVGLGYGNLQGNTVGACNIAIGCRTMQCNTLNGCNNIALGSDALWQNTSGCFNIALGTCALGCNTTGCDNVAMGCWVLNCNTTGQENIAIGKGVLFCNSTGADNIGMGCNALCRNSTGAYNVAIGAGALCASTTAGCNIAIGTGALRNNTSASNIAIGYQSLTNNTTGARNVAFGVSALQCNIVGNDNTALGISALCCNNSTNNVAIGGYALTANRTGFDNTAVGLQALMNNLTGGFNIGIGENTLFCNTAGSSNTAIGTGAGFCSTGSGNVFIGYTAGQIETVASNRLHIANTSVCTLIYGEFDTKCVKICGKLEASGSITPANSTDAGMPNNSIYFSTTSSKLVYKDAGGIVNALY